MKLEQIYYPINKELNLVGQELKNFNKNIKTDLLKEILNNFFKVPGKQIRPTLALLSAGIINNQLIETKNYQLIQLSVFLELMHSASLIHDDIIDGDFIRRGQKTLNKIYGRKIAVLAGDVIYAQAFSIISNSLPKEFANIIVDLTENMCAAEIEQANNCVLSKDKYYKIIEGKTAFFMAVSCKLGAVIAGGDNDKINSLENYGYNLGMAYQILDDFMDDDLDTALNITLEDAQNFANRAIASIEAFENNQYKQSLINLVNHIVNTSYKKVSIS